MSAHASFDPQQDPRGGWGFLSALRGRETAHSRRKKEKEDCPCLNNQDPSFWCLAFLSFFIFLTSRRSEHIWHSRHTTNDTTTNVFVGHLEAATHVIMYLFIFRGKQQLVAAPALSLYLGQNKAISSSLHALSQLFYSDTLFSVVPYGRNSYSL